MKKRLYCLFFIVMILFLFPVIPPAHGADELYITGTVKYIDHRSGLVTVDVKSENCPGIRQFRVDDVSELEGLTGKKISFFINSSTCKGDAVYKMYDITLSKGKKQ